MYAVVMTVKLWIDDLRTPPEGYVWAKTSQDAIDYLSGDQYFNLVSFDHDLGGDDTSRLVVDWMRDNLDVDEWPRHINVHSANPVGVRNLIADLRDYAPPGVVIQQVSVLDKG